MCCPRYPLLHLLSKQGKRECDRENEEKGDSEGVEGKCGEELQRVAGAAELLRGAAVAEFAEGSRGSRVPEGSSGSRVCRG
jgi:hypothetical protein